MALLHSRYWVGGSEIYFHFDVNCGPLASIQLSSETTILVLHLLLQKYKNNKRFLRFEEVCISCSVTFTKQTAVQSFDSAFLVTPWCVPQLIINNFLLHIIPFYVYAETSFILF